MYGTPRVSVMCRPLERREEWSGVGGVSLGECEGVTEWGRNKAYTSRRGCPCPWVGTVVQL